MLYEYPKYMQDFINSGSFESAIENAFIENPIFDEVSEKLICNMEISNEIKINDPEVATVTIDCYCNYNDIKCNNELSSNVSYNINNAINSISLLNFNEIIKNYPSSGCLSTSLSNKASIETIKEFSKKLIEDEIESFDGFYHIYCDSPGYIYLSNYKEQLKESNIKIFFREYIPGKKAVLCGRNVTAKVHYDNDSYSNKFSGYTNYYHKICNNILWVINPPMDRLLQINCLTWTFIGGYGAFYKKHNDGKVFNRAIVFDIC